MTRPRGYIGRAAALLAVVLAWTPSQAERAPTEVAVKATYLVKFGAYVNWPGGTLAGEAAPVVICLVGRDPFGQVADRAAAGQTIDQRPILVRRLARIDREAGCHIAYLAGSREQTVSDGIAATRGMPVLTVTDTRHALTRGMVHFETNANRVRFHIDAGAAVRSGLTISSKLLSLALSVNEGKQ